MDFPFYIGTVIVVSIISAVFVVLFLSALSNRSIKDTLIDLWRTFFGKNDA